jgi:hypothetical protein
LQSKTGTSSPAAFTFQDALSGSPSGAGAMETRPEQEAKKAVRRIRNKGFFISVSFN